MSLQKHVILERNSNLALRDSANAIVHRFLSLGYSEVFYDLSNVEVMSRSFADQLYKDIQQAAQVGIKIQLINMCEQVESVMSAVSKTQHNEPKETKPYVERNFTFETINDFYNMLEGKVSLT